MQPFTVTIGIPAHNEERNIGALLDSIISQRQEGYVLEKVIVACDGCTDGTADKVKQYQGRLPMLQLVDDGERIGQAQRINQFFTDNTSDILITLDADTTLGSSGVISVFAREFSYDLRTGVVAGADHSYPPRTFFESVAVTVVDLWYEMRQDYNGGDTVHNAHGRIMSFSRDFTKATRIPEMTNGADHYTYFRSKQLKMGFRYAKEAIVYYHEPDSLKDFIKQRSRFHVINDSMVQIFGAWIKPYYSSLPLGVKLYALRKMFLRHPLRLMLTLILEVFMWAYMYFKQPVPVGSVWETVQSTKH